MIKITSIHNPKIKWLVKLREKASMRSAEGVFMIEGVREILLAIRNGYFIQEGYVCRSLAQEVSFNEIVQRSPEISWSEVNPQVYNKIAVRGTTEGIVVTAKPGFHQPENLNIPGNALILVVEQVEKPGNLGALLRTADASGLDAIIICDPMVDLYNPNVIRSSLGCLFTQQIALADSNETIRWLKDNAIKVFAATPEGAVVYHQVDYTGSSAIVVGSEADGLTGKWMDQADERIVIPMKGEHHSLNVSVSAAIVIFEAVRQRS